jgi:hypothetical protein
MANQQQNLVNTHHFDSLKTDSIFPPGYSKMAISYNWLIGIYLLIPIFLSVAAIDIFFFHGQIRKMLPKQPEEIFLFVILFDFPHIMASFFSLADKTYLSYYKKKLVIGLPLLALASFLFPMINATFSTLLYIAWGNIHFVRQQTGITGMLMRQKNRFHSSWECIAFMIIFLSYLTTNYQHINIGITRQTRDNILIGLIIAYTIISLLASTASQSRKGTIYFWATSLIPVATALCLILRYPLIANLIPRCIHDITAFTFYSTHDHNRNQSQWNNGLYRLFSPLKIPIVWLTPILAIVVAYLLKYGGFIPPIPGLIIMAGLFHYYLDGFQWKQGTVHQQQLIFKD